MKWRGLSARATRRVRGPQARRARSSRVGDGRHCERRHARPEFGRHQSLGDRTLRGGLSRRQGIAGVGAPTENLSRQCAPSGVVWAYRHRGGRRLGHRIHDASRRWSAAAKQSGAHHRRRARGRGRNRAAHSRGSRRRNLSDRAFRFSCRQRWYDDFSQTSDEEVRKLSCICFARGPSSL